MKKEKQQGLIDEVDGVSGCSKMCSPMGLWSADGILTAIHRASLLFISKDPTLLFA